jgi:hypothetical protein
MKRILFFLGALLAITPAFSQIVIISDIEFKNRLLESSSSNLVAKDIDGNYIKIDSNDDGEIQLAEAINVSYLNLDFGLNPKTLLSLDGIDYFSNLEHLTAYELGVNEFAYALPKLSKLILDYHLIVNLDLSNCPSLIELSTIQSPSSNFPLTEICLKNGISMQSLLVLNAPNLSYVCVDENEELLVQSALSSYPGVTINSSCNESTLLLPGDEVKEVHLFPNPIVNEFSVISEMEIRKVEILNLNGQTLLSTENSTNINSDLLRSGVFIVLIYTNKDIIMRKLVKK